MTFQPFSTDVNEVAEVLKRGGVAIVPTDTVYGLAASLESISAIQRLYELKGRTWHKPLPVLVANPEVAARYSQSLTDIAGALIAEFWPGPLTIVVEASDSVPAACLSGGSTVGLRMPDHPVLLSLLDACGGALAVTSANRSDEPESSTAAGAAASLDHRADIVLDAGETPGGQPSTVVDATGHTPAILRAGPITARAILDAAGVS